MRRKKSDSEARLPPPQPSPMLGEGEDRGAEGMKLEAAIASPLTPTPLPRGERGYSHAPINSVPSPLEGEGQGEGYRRQGLPT